MNKYIFILLFLGLLLSCTENEKKTSLNSTDSTIKNIFKKLSKESTSLDFLNRLTETDSLNYFTYSYIYMGGGVSAGDINNDGLTDLFFTGNQVANKLYLNKGDLKFEDVSKKAGIEGDQRWYTGSTMADVNGDGLLDIYVSVAGQSGNKENQLFINNGDTTFSEKGKIYNLNDSGNSVNATFLDYDKDGDLDVFIANYPVTPFTTDSKSLREMMNLVTDQQSDQLYRNDGDTFTKVTEEAGMKVYSLALSATAADLNNDGWQDIYVSSDFNSPDLLYINNQDGTFTNTIAQSTKHTSYYGMGADIGDFDNDGHMDILQVDMDAEINRRSKANMASMDPYLLQEVKEAGFQTQFMQNSLQHFIGTTKENYPQYSEISRLAGISSTDWSWSPLFADLDNDGNKDIFVSNGSRREINNKDYFAALAGEKRHKDSLLIKSLRMPSETLPNYAFRNNGDLTFDKVTTQWGLEHSGFSNGAIYVDLDNDGDLEIVTNNIDEEVSLFENTSNQFNNFISLSFESTEKNTMGIGVKATISTKENNQYQELTLTRGFQSSVAPKLHFGLGDVELIETIKVEWPNGRLQFLENVKANQNLIVDYKDSENIKVPDEELPHITYFDSSTDSLAIYKHKENLYNDYTYEILLPHRTSSFGPGVVVGDLNGDQLDDFYVGAAHEYPGGMFFQKADGTFEQQKTKILVNDRNYEDLDALIFDPDNDGDNDLYIVSGGNEFAYTSEMLQDRLYVNDGKGNFSKSFDALPKMITSGSRVFANDFDHDGDQDLFVGGRLFPANYPYPPHSYILENVSTKGKPQFKDVTESVAPFLKEKFGMVTSAVFMDYDKDGWDDLIVAGEWMPIKVLRNNKGEFEDVTEDLGLEDTTGWWFGMAQGDFDNDGDTDLIAGNLGLNYKYKASKDATFDVNLNDFDGNKTNDIVLSYYNQGEKYPVRGRECSSQQMPVIKKKFKSYDEFSTATLTDIYDEEKLEKGIHYQVTSFASAYIENKGDRFEIHPLPNEAQISPINQILVDDFDKDDILDILVAGNLYQSEAETPRADAGHGLLLTGDGKGNFTPVPGLKSGFFAHGDVKDLARITISGQAYIIAAKNDDFLQFIRYNGS
ncbi:VCBS repeat-containing protein [Maribacter sp. 2210JD10-5]|uniref:VCBS repeat-containing protein n=1 Tax=Maribacter sp. 2210JD10-5 TaxID=3386272 RepID=UPI0039BC9A20